MELKTRPVFDPATLWRAGALSLVWIFLFYDTLRRIADDWRVDENYSHGFFVPLISAYVIWTERDRIFSTPRAPRLAAGAIVTGVSILLLFAGIAGAELYLSRIAMMLSVVGLILYFAGTRWLGRLSFPIGIWLLAIPIPNVIFYRIALPLQLIASEYAMRVIRLVGIPALREGNIIELAQMKLQVVEACSGIRSLISLIFLAVVFAYFYEKSRWRRIAIVIGVVPIAILANAARVAGTGVMAHLYGIQAAEGFLHGFSGWVVFLLAMLFLGAYAAVLKTVSGPRHRS